MKYIISILFLISYVPDKATEPVATVDLIEVLNGNLAEAEYYYQNNWQVLREQAMEKGYIIGYQLIMAEPTEELPISIMLITTYKDMAQYEKAEENFGELIKARGDLRLLNDKKPGEFRKMIYSKGPLKTVVHRGESEDGRPKSEARGV